MEHIADCWEGDMKSMNPVVKLVLSCLDTATCEVAFEPEGALITLEKDHPVTVEIRGPGEGVVEVSFDPKGIRIGAWSGGDTFAWDDAGEPLRI
jgi:hypothetical protein